MRGRIPRNPSQTETKPDRAVMLFGDMCWGCTLRVSSTFVKNYEGGNENPLSNRPLVTTLSLPIGAGSGSLAINRQASSSLMYPSACRSCISESFNLHGHHSPFDGLAVLESSSSFLPSCCSRFSASVGFPCSNRGAESPAGASGSSTTKLAPGASMASGSWTRGSDILYVPRAS